MIPCLCLYFVIFYSGMMVYVCFVILSLVFFSTMIGWEECLINDLFLCRDGCYTFT